MYECVFACMCARYEKHKRTRDNIYYCLKITDNIIYGLSRHKFTIMCAHKVNVYLISILEKNIVSLTKEIDFQNKSVLLFLSFFVL